MHRRFISPAKPRLFPRRVSRLKFSTRYHDLALAHQAAAEELARIIPTMDMKQILPQLNNVLKACGLSFGVHSQRAIVTYGGIMSEQNTITAFYEQDHDRLDELFKTFQQLKRSDFAKAKEAFKEFSSACNAISCGKRSYCFHCGRGKPVGSEEGPTVVMRVEHRQIGQQFEAIHSKVSEQNPDSDKEEQTLLDILGSHNRKEERALYPAIDQVASLEDRETVFKSMVIG